MSSIEEIARGGYWREADAQELVHAWQASCQPTACFVANVGCSPVRLGRWVRCLAQVAQPTFVELRVIEPISTPIEVLVGGLVIRVPSCFEPAALRRVIDVLAERC